MTDDKNIPGLLPFLVTIAMIFILAVAATLASFNMCASQPTIHCLDGFYKYSDMQHDGEHIYCLKKKYEPPTSSVQPDAPDKQ